MNHNRLGQALSEIHDRVDVPVLDRRNVHQRARRLRRRRRGAQVATGVIATAAVTALAVSGLAHRYGGSVIATDTTGSSSAVSRSAARGVPVVLDGRVQMLSPDGSIHDTGREGTPIGVYGDRLVTLDHGDLAGLPAGDLTGVRAAFADATGATYQDADGVHQVGKHGSSPSGVVTGADADAGAGDLIGAGERVYVTASASGPILHGPDGAELLSLGSDGAVVQPQSVEVAGDTVVVVADRVVQVFAADGSRRGGFLGGETGALSPSGDTYAYAANVRESRDGMRSGLVLYATATGDEERVPLREAAVDLTWSDGALYVLTTDDASRTVWQCDTQTCRELLRRPGTGLSLR